MGLIIGQGTKSGGGGGGASAAEKQLVQATTLDGRLYNLWEVLPQVKADPRAQGYACIMLAEYWQGYNSLVLQGANAFLTCDGDFYQMSSTTDEVTHYWHDGNTMMDRWVAYLFTNENTDYTVASANVAPRNVLIDGILGNITSTNMSRCQNYWTTEGSSFLSFSATIQPQFNRNATIGTIRELKTIQYGAIDVNPNPMIIQNLICGVVVSKGIIFRNRISGTPSLVNVSFPHLTITHYIFDTNIQNGFNALVKIDAPKLKSATGIFSATWAVDAELKYINTPSLTSLTNYRSALTNNPCAKKLIHWEIGQGFNSNLNLNPCSFETCLLTDSNDLVEDLTQHPTWSNLDQWLFNFEHLIVDKLADLTGQTAKTITLAAAPYAAITSEIRAKMSAKNWNLASA